MIAGAHEIGIPLTAVTAEAVGVAGEMAGETLGEAIVMNLLCSRELGERARALLRRKRNPRQILQTLCLSFRERGG